MHHLGNVVNTSMYGPINLNVIIDAFFCSFHFNPVTLLFQKVKVDDNRGVRRLNMQITMDRAGLTIIPY